MRETEHATASTNAAADKDDERRALWDELPAPVEPEDTTTSKDAAPTPPDLVPDPDHEFMIRHAG